LPPVPEAYKSKPLPVPQKEPLPSLPAIGVVLTSLDSSVGMQKSPTKPPKPPKPKDLKTSEVEDDNIPVEVEIKKKSSISAGKAKLLNLMRK